MRKALSLIPLLLTLTCSFSASANQCGIKPISPIGCSDSAQCRCSANGSCEWIFNCGDNDGDNSATFDLGKSLNAGAEYKALQRDSEPQKREDYLKPIDQYGLILSKLPQSERFALGVAMVTCQGKYTDTNKRLDACSKFHEMLSLIFGMQKTIHEACIKNPRMKSCIGAEI